MDYWDTSALLKLYIHEPDSAYFLALISASVGALVTSDLARVEIYSALSRKELAGELPAGEADVIYSRFKNDATSGRLMMTPIGGDILDQTVDLSRRAHGHIPAIRIRSLDAIHVASAVVTGAQTMVATDSRLREVAALMGLGLRP